MRTSLVSALLSLTCAGLATAHGVDRSCRPMQKRAFNLDKRQLQSGGEGQSVTAGGGASAARYSCDPSTCRLPNCHCADTNPPGGLDPKDVPQFIVFTADDAVQDYTIKSVDQFLAQRKNPNGCKPVMTYFVSLNYTNYAQVTELYVNGNDVADHTMTHQEQPATNAEIDGNLITLNALAGIPFKSITGYRAPFLNYSRGNLEHLAATNFLYDSSSTASVPVTDPNTDAFWPYTLDNGMANDCNSVDNICGGEPKLPGFWEIPMYAIFDERGAAGAHLMDPWLDSANASDVLSWMKTTFTDHYNGKRQPFGIYTHPIHLATNYPGLKDPVDQIRMLNEFLDWATTSSSMQNVWIVSNEQLLAWMRNPVPASQLNTLDAFKCTTPAVSQRICNGFASNNNLLEHCISNTAGDPLNNSPFYTCYGCPVTTPSPQQPNPPQRNNDGTLRTRIPANCDTPFWDPVAAKCLCTGSACAFDDETRPIGPNGSNLTSSGTTNTGSGAGGSPSASSDPYRTFSGATAKMSGGVLGWTASMVVAAVGGAAMVFM